MRVPNVTASVNGTWARNNARPFRSARVSKSVTPRPNSLKRPSTLLSHRMNLLGRKTGPDEIADAALFLAHGHLASGQTLYVDSGQHLLSQPRDVIYLARERDEA